MRHYREEIDGRIAEMRVDKRTGRVVPELDSLGMSRSTSVLSHAERLVMLWLYGFVVLVIVIEVVRRFAFDFSSLWGEEAARFAFIYLVWISAAVGVRNRAHIRFGIVTDLLPPRGAASLSVLASIATIVFAMFAFYWSIEPVMTSLRFGSVTEGLRLPRTLFLVAVPVGFVLVLVSATKVLIEDLGALRDGRRPMDGQKLFD